MKKSELENLPVGLHHCGPCLYLQVRGEGETLSRSWVMRYLWAGRRRDQVGHLGFPLRARVAPILTGTLPLLIRCGAGGPFPLAEK